MNKVDGNAELHLRTASELKPVRNWSSALPPSVFFNSDEKLRIKTRGYW
jgi:hypothetical protein